MCFHSRDQSLNLVPGTLFYPPKGPISGGSIAADGTPTCLSFLCSVLPSLMNHTPRYLNTFALPTLRCVEILSMKITNTTGNKTQPCMVELTENVLYLLRRLQTKLLIALTQLLYEGRTARSNCSGTSSKIPQEMQ